MIREEAGKLPHHVIYRLRKSPPGRVVRHLHRYDPAEVMRGEQHPPGFLSWLSEQAQRRLTDLREQHEPPAPDIVETLSEPDCDLRIASRRAKPGWDHLATIEYLDQLYEVGERRAGTSAYPYVYLLRKLPPGKIVRTVLRYRPDAPPAPDPSQ